MKYKIESGEVILPIYSDMPTELLLMHMNLSSVRDKINKFFLSNYKSDWLFNNVSEKLFIKLVRQLNAKGKACDWEVHDRIGDWTCQLKWQLERDPADDALMLLRDKCIRQIHDSFF